MEDAIQLREETNPSAQTPSTSLSKFEFKGEGLEYFKIWIVNIQLTVVTLGIYSAWATVRNNRYFYSNLYLDNHNFSYLAQPLTILKGRLIAIAVFAAYTILSQSYPIVGIVLALVFTLAIPYFVIQSIAFSRRMTAYRNIQFRFDASYGEAFMAFIIWPILGVLSIGILYPLAIVKTVKFMVNNSSYGTTKFSFSGTYSDYGIIFLTMIGVGLVLGLPVWAIGFMVPALAPILPIVSLLIYLGLGIYFMTQTYNLAKVIITNIFLIVITLGLYLPAAKVRMVKYVASHVSMNIAGNLDDFQAAEEQNINAIGEEMGNVFELGV